MNARKKNHFGDMYIQEIRTDMGLAPTWMLWGGGGVIEVLHVIKKIEEIDFPKEGLAIGVYAFGCTFHSCDTQMIHIVCINAVKLSCLPYIPFHLYELKFFFDCTGQLLYLFGGRLIRMKVL